MGKIKYLKEVEDFISKTYVFSLRDIKIIIRFKKGNPAYAKLLVHNLIKKNKIYRVTRGYYSRLNDPMVIAYCIKPSYIGLETALSLHKLWDQETNAVLLTSRNVRQGVRKVFESNVLVHQIKREYFFGYEYIDYFDLKIPVSDVEKTLIDLIYFKRHLSKDLIKEFKKRADVKKLKEYLRKYDKEFRGFVISFIKQG